MENVTAAAVANASSADLGTSQGVASVLVLKKAMTLQAQSAAQLLQALPQPALATEGSVGTRVNTFA
jgi:malonyl CoA-acyl carrier protein transacylase